MRNKYLIVIFFFAILCAGAGFPFAAKTYARGESTASAEVIDLTILPSDTSPTITVSPTDTPAVSPTALPIRNVTIELPSEGIGIDPTSTPSPTQTPIPTAAPTTSPTHTPALTLASFSIAQELYPDDKRSWTSFAFRELIALTAKRYDLDPQLIYATIMTESEGEIFAYRYERHLGEASLCMGQILVSTARSLGFEGEEEQLYDPAICIDLIGKYHRTMLSTYGQLTPQQLTRAYNTGSPYKRPVWGHLWRFSQWYEEKS